MKALITALLNQLKNHPSLTYAAQCAYLSEDPYELMEKNRFPFFNVVPGDQRIEMGLDNFSKVEFERHIYPVMIQFATSSLRLNVAIMGDDTNNKKGILDFSDDIWTAIKFDRTVNNTVDGIIPSNSVIPNDFIKDNNSLFIARAEIKIEFYKDFGLL